MALTECRGCARPISVQAQACPHCGEPGVSITNPAAVKRVPAFVAMIDAIPVWIVVTVILVTVVVTGVNMTRVAFLRFEDEPLPPPQVSQQVTSRDGRLQLDLPQGWLKVPPDVEGMILLAYRKDRQMALSVFAEDKADLRQLDPHIQQLDNYAELMRSLLLQELVGGGEDAPARTTIDGHPAVQCTLHGSVDGVPTRLLQTIVETPSTFYQIRGMAPQDEFESVQEELMTITRSCQVNGT